MAVVNEETPEINLKVVLAGPNGSARVEVAHLIYDGLSDSGKGEFSLLSEGTLAVFFDFGPPPTQEIKLRFYVFTLPDDIHFFSVREVLRGVSGIIWLLDPSVGQPEVIRSSFRKLRETLGELKAPPIPIVALSYNTQGYDFNVTRLQRLLELNSLRLFEASQADSQGALDSLTEIIGVVLCGPDGKKRQSSAVITPIIPPRERILPRLSDLAAFLSPPLFFPAVAFLLILAAGIYTGNRSLLFSIPLGMLLGLLLSIWIVLWRRFM